MQEFEFALKKFKKLYKTKYRRQLSILLKTLKFEYILGPMYKLKGQLPVEARIQI